LSHLNIAGAESGFILTAVLSNFGDRNCALFAGFARHAANAIIRAPAEKGVLVAIFIDQRKQLQWAVLDTITASLALIKIDGDDEHEASKIKMRAPGRTLSLV
jgi:hypothetical protein